MKRTMRILAALMFMLIGCGCIYTEADAAEKNFTITNDYNGQNYLNVGDTGKVELDLSSAYTDITITEVTYESTNESVIYCDSTGNYKALAKGEGGIKANYIIEQAYTYNDYVYGEDGALQVQEVVDTYTIEGTATIYFIVQPDMSSAYLSKTSIKLYTADSYGSTEFTVNLKGCETLSETDGYTSFFVESSNSKISVYASMTDNVIKVSAYGTGTTTVKFTINDKELKLKVTLKQVKINKTSLLIVTGKKAQLKIKGISNGLIKWKSTKKSAVTVNSKGVIKARKNGNAVIIANVKGARVGCAVSVVTAKMSKIIKTAKRIGKTCKYSQPMRMMSGYYDCSSLVWRAYKTAGITFGNRSYAPVAADIAKWCSGHGKRISKSMSTGQINKMIFKPGDLYFGTGESNGRYLGIYHVEMFAGYDCYGISASGKPMLTTCWANRGEGYGYGGLIMRP